MSGTRRCGGGPVSPGAPGSTPRPAVRRFGLGLMESLPAENRGAIFQDEEFFFREITSTNLPIAPLSGRNWCRNGLDTSDVQVTNTSKKCILYRHIAIIRHFYRVKSHI